MDGESEGREVSEVIEESEGMEVTLGRSGEGSSVWGTETVTVDIWERGRGREGSRETIASTNEYGRVRTVQYTIVRDNVRYTMYDVRW
jgi:hypothetical protein